MTNCLFRHGHAAVTVELNVRFRNPVAIGRSVVVKARIESALPPIYVLAGEIRQDGELMATATGRFAEKSLLAWSRTRTV
jgi:acyl-coenzyme A thioesterase PaaI-like protein